MGFWSTVFGFDGHSDSGERIREKVSVHSDDQSVQGNKYTFTGGDRGEHVHQSYEVDRSTGKYTEHHGGENSDERSYNK